MASRRPVGAVGLRPAGGAVAAAGQPYSRTSFDGVGFAAAAAAAVDNWPLSCGWDEVLLRHCRCCYLLRFRLLRWRIKAEGSHGGDGHLSRRGPPRLLLPLPQPPQSRAISTVVVG